MEGVKVTIHEHLKYKPQMDGRTFWQLYFPDIETGCLSGWLQPKDGRKIATAIECHDSLVAAVERLIEGGECTCNDRREVLAGEPCEICFARGVLASTKAES